MTWLDLITVVLFVLVGFVEAKRGAVPAAVDLCAGLLGLGLAKTWAPDLASSIGSEGSAFLVLFGGAVVFTAVASTLVDMYTKWDIGPYDSTLAGILGVIVGLVLAHGAFHAALVAGGGVADTAEASLMAGEVYELRTAHAIGDMLRNLGRGKSITDHVKESQQ